jgi:hypothetical protein
MRTTYALDWEFCHVRRLAWLKRRTLRKPELPAAEIYPRYPTIAALEQVLRGYQQERDGMQGNAMWL